MPCEPRLEPTFVALSGFVVANGMEDAVKAAFRERPHRVEGAPGFLRMDVLSPAERSQELRLVTYWTDQQSFVLWHRSHDFHQSQSGIPAGLELIPAEIELRFFTSVAS